MRTLVALLFITETLTKGKTKWSTPGNKKYCHSAFIVGFKKWALRCFLFIEPSSHCVTKNIVTWSQPFDKLIFIDIQS